MTQAQALPAAKSNSFFPNSTWKVTDEGFEGCVIVLQPRLHAALQ